MRVENEGGIQFACRQMKIQEGSVTKALQQMLGKKDDAEPIRLMGDLARKNLVDTVARASVEKSGLDEMASQLDEMIALASRAQSGLLNDEERAELQGAMQGYLDGLDKTVQGARYDDIAFLDTAAGLRGGKPFAAGYLQGSRKAVCPGARRSSRPAGRCARKIAGGQRRLRQPLHSNTRGPEYQIQVQGFAE